ALLAVAGGFCGLAFLVKGFAAFVLAVGVIVPFALWDRRWKDALRMAWLPIVAALVVCLPWSIAIAIRERDFWRYFFEVQNVERFAAASAEHQQKFWYFIPFLLIGTFPWNTFLAAIVAGVGRTGLRDSFVRFLICWAIFPFLFFSLSRGKLATYI